MGSKIKGVSFDFANTLVYQCEKPTSFKEISDFLIEEGYEIGYQEIAAVYEYIFMIEYPREKYPTWIEWINRMEFHLNQEFSSSIRSALSKMLNKGTESFTLFDDVQETLHKLSTRDFKLSIVTTIPSFRMRKVLEPIRNYFISIVNGETAGCAKDNPKMYRFDLEQKGVEAKNNMFVGDDELTDIVRPRLSGQVTSKIMRHEISNKKTVSDYQLTSLSELIPIINRINER